MTAIIVDDEPQSHQVLKSLLSKYHPDITVLASAYSVQEGYEKVVECKPDILFQDIELPDGKGFDLLRKLNEPDFIVIFITAHPRYAMEAIHFGAFDFLLKGGDMKDRLQIALNKARKRNEKELNLEQLKLLIQFLSDTQEKSNLPSRMSVSNLDGIYFFDIKDIIRLEAQKNYTMFRIDGADSNYLASKNIGVYLSHLQLYPDFKQVHRSHLANRCFVVKLVQSESYLLMKNGDQIPVSRNYRDGILDWMNGI